MMLRHLSFSVLFAVLSMCYSTASFVHAAEYHFTATRDACLFTTAIEPIAIGDQIAHGSGISNQYIRILDNTTYADSYFPEAIDIAYAMYLVAERIGDTRARKKLNWLYAYVQPENRDVVTSIIYRKFSQGYLSKCFLTDIAIQNMQSSRPSQKKHALPPHMRAPDHSNTNYDLYMFHYD